MTLHRVPRLCTAAVTLFILFAATAFCAHASADIQPRIADAYTAWDDYFFYAAFQVNDHNVLSTNRTPASQPQQDDDIEVFFDTSPSDGAKVRTPNTYQMAVSAGSGAYFSVGNGTKIPVGKLVLTYKYAVTIDGTLNDPNDNDTGFTVEIAIPWEELGRTGPPAPGEQWGFNVISRNRDSLDTPSTSFASLSSLVHSNADVQDPSKWTKITFITTLANQTSGPSVVYCPHVATDANYPVVDGVVRDGEWDTHFGFSFGQQMIPATAPTKQEEPNIDQSPFANSLQPVVRTPVGVGPALPTPQSDTPDYDITLPGGGEVHVGKIETPPPPQAFVPEEPVQRGHGHIQYQPGSSTNPLAPNLPADIDQANPIGPSIDPNASLALTDQTTLTPLVLADYTFEYPDTPVLIDYLDQPMDGFGPAFGGGRTQWHRSQLSDARRAGVDVLLVTVDPSDPASIAGLATLVESMKEMNAAGQDFPLLGLRISGGDAASSLRTFLMIVPDEFRAEVILPDDQRNQAAYIVLADGKVDIDALKAVVANFSDTVTLLVTGTAGNDYLTIDLVSPGGRDDTGKVIGREQTHTYAQAWQHVYSSNPSWVLIDSWNDYKHGTEVASSREYAEQYADLTRIAGLQWAGSQQWDAKYLQNDVPTVMAPKTIYTVAVRVVNNGSLPWRAGENYSLCYRWYKDGRLYDDSAPRLPIDHDVYPGQSTTINVGVVAQNSYGTDIEPGLYTLVFDMVQGQDRWFTYVGSQPLRVPVRVVDTADAYPAKVTFLGSTTPGILDPNATYPLTISIRNEGQETWTPSNVSVTVAENTVNSVGHLVLPVFPGAVGKVTVPVQLGSSAADGQITTLTWTVKTPGTSASWTEHVCTVPKDLGATFTIDDIDREVKAGDNGSAKVGVLNTGPETWNKGDWKIAYRWYYLDGRPATDVEGTFPISSTVQPGTETEVDFSYKSPLYPGRYQLLLAVEAPDGSSTLDSVPTRGKAVLPLLVQVTQSRDALSMPVDLSKEFNADGIGFESSPSTGDFDGGGKSLPGDFMPPDGTSEVGVNPLLAGKPGLPQYPSGYYSNSSGAGPTSNHRISFVFGPKGADNVVICKGQLIDMPAGNWTAIHLLMASTGSNTIESAQFGIAYKDGINVSDIVVANWTKVPDPAIASVGLRLPYSLVKGEVVSPNPVFLGDYSITTDWTRTMKRISLPNDPDIKVLAITVER